MNHITSATFIPTGALDDPILFESLEDALAFSRITGRLIYAARREDAAVYQIWPGGRMRMYSAELLQDVAERLERRLARRRTRVAE